MKPKSYKDILTKVAQEYQVPEHRVKAVIEHFYSELKTTLSEGRESQILIHKLGNIRMQKLPLKHMLEKKRFQDEELKLRLDNHLKNL